MASGSKGREGEEICIQDHDHAASLASKQGAGEQHEGGAVASLSTLDVILNRTTFVFPED